MIYPASDIEKTKKEIEDVVGIETSNAIPCSGKTGEGIDEILEAIVNKLPAPKGALEEKLKCLLVDSWYDSYLGVVILIRVINGKLKKGMKIKLMSNNQEHIIEKVGVFTPKPSDIEELNSGEIGFIITGIKSLSETKVGDTICDHPIQSTSHWQVLNLANLLYFVDCSRSIVLNIKSLKMVWLNLNLMTQAFLMSQSHLVH